MKSGTRPHVFGLPIDPLTMDGTIARCRDLIEARIAVQHVVLNAGKIVLLRNNQSLRQIIGNCDLVNADGQSIVWAGRLLGVRIPERVTGCDLMERLFVLAEHSAWPVYFLGATDKVLASFVRVVEKKYPKLRIAGYRNGYFDDDASVADKIRESGARLLFVGISSPRKEVFLSEQLRNMGPVFAMGVGGSFDVWAGKTQRAPMWMQHAGLEWFYRLIQEPRRMWRRYLIGNSIFVWLTMRELWGKLTGKERHIDSMQS